MTEIPYGRLTALEYGFGGRAQIAQSLARGERLTGIRIVSFDFSFNTPNLRAGVAFYSPTADDLLLDAWVEIRQSWNGTTPLADFATFKLNPFGIFNDSLQPVPLAAAADTEPNELGIGLGATPSLAAMQALGSTLSLLHVPAIPSGGSVEQRLVLGSVADRGFRAVPSRFSGQGPLKLAVSQDGSAGGTDPGSTQGSATLYLLIATPQKLTP